MRDTVFPYLHAKQQKLVNQPVTPKNPMEKLMSMLLDWVDVQKHKAKGFPVKWEDKMKWMALHHIHI